MATSIRDPNAPEPKLPTEPLALLYVDLEQMAAAGSWDARTMKRVLEIVAAHRDRGKGPPRPSA